MRYTLLQIVQKTLSSMGSDEVESINDNTEAEDVASIAEDVYYELLNREEWPLLTKPINITPLSDSDNPTALVLQDEVRSVHSIKYDIKDNDDDNKDYKDITYLRPADFLDKTLRRKSSDSNVVVVNPYEGSSVEFFIEDDKAPDWWTSFDDEYIFFDSYDSSVDSWVQSSKTLAIGEVVPTFLLEDDYVIDLPIHMHPLFLAEVKTVAHVYIKQEQSVKDEQKVLRNMSRLRRTKGKTGIDYYDLRARKNFGRRQHVGANHPTLGRR